MLKLSKIDKKMIAIGLTLAIIFVIVGVLLFSYSMETLDVQAEQLGARDVSVYTAPFPDYVILGFENEAGNILLGVISILAIFGVTFGVATLLRKSKGGCNIQIKASLRDILEGAESLIYVEDSSNKRGLLQSINPLVTFVITLFMISASLFVSSLPYLTLMCLIPLVLSIASKVSLKDFFARTALIPLFSAVISLPILFVTSGAPALSANLGLFNLTVTFEGVQRFLSFSVRVWFCVASLTVLILSMGFSAFLEILSSIKVPSVVIHLFSLTYRYLFVSIREVQKVLIAKEARTYITRRTVSLDALKHSGALLATTFIRTYERSERVYMAMKSRGFDINNTDKSSIPPLHGKDLLFALSTTVIFGLIFVL